MLLLAQQHQEAAATAGDPKNANGARLADTAASLLGPLTPLEYSQLSEWSRAYDKVHVLDARFEYEYEGGHIRGAVNVTSHSQAEAILMGPEHDSDKSLAAAGPSAPHRSGSRVCVLIHCEFSKKRGPKCFAFLRQRDRSLNMHRYPELHFPELYVIAGGYQAFFLQSIPSAVSTSPSLCSIGGSGSAPCASAVAHALCTPPEYVAMADKRYRKEYAVCWSRMKKSGAAAGANGTLLGGAGGFHSPKDNSNGSGAENGAGGSGSNGNKSAGGPPRSRQGRTRSYAEMDNSSTNSPASCGTLSVHSSPAFMPRSLSAAALCSPASAASPVLGLMGSPVIPSHPRPHRGLSLSLDSSAAAGGSNGAALAASTAAPFATSAVPAPRRTNSAFSFKRTSSAASFAAMSGLGIGVPPSNSPSPSPSPSSAASAAGAGAGAGAGPAVPSFPSFFGSGSVPPCSSPILSYGWSTEGRSSTPSPFMPESPRFSHSRSSAPSPLGWSSPSLGGFGSGSGSGSGALGGAYGHASSARGTPLSMLSEDSPRSRSASVVPGAFAGTSAAGAAVGALPPPMLAVGASSGGFASPQGRRRARAASALDFASAAASSALPYSQSRSPSSALHSMHLRSSPSLSLSGNSASTSSYAYAQSSRSSSSPSPAPFECASAYVYGGVASPDVHVRAHSATAHMDSPPGLMPARTPTAAAGGASPSQKQEAEAAGESEVPAAAGSSAQKRARYARERGDRDRAAVPHAAVALVYPPSPPLVPSAAPGALGAAAAAVSPSKPTVTTRLASAHAELAAATAACAMEQ